MLAGAGSTADTNRACGDTTPPDTGATLPTNAAGAPAAAPTAGTAANPANPVTPATPGTTAAANAPNNGQRSIICDIRYVLLLIDQLGECPRLIQELSLVSRR